MLSNPCGHGEAADTCLLIRRLELCPAREMVQVRGREFSMNRIQLASDWTRMHYRMECSRSPIIFSFPPWSQKILQMIWTTLQLTILCLDLTNILFLLWERRLRCRIVDGNFRLGATCRPMFLVSGCDGIITVLEAT